MAGRPTKLTPEVQERICLAIRNGNYVETAASLAGINKTTLYDWLKRGARAGRGPYHEFSNVVEEALAQSENLDLEVVSRAAQTHEVVKEKQVVNAKTGEVETLIERTWEFDWRAAAWRLERKAPERWGPVQKTQLTGKDGGPVVVSWGQLAQEADGNG